MILFPPAKINLGLRILRKRADGYHDLDTIFYSIELTDVLEILPVNSTETYDQTEEKIQWTDSGLAFRISGIVPNGNIEDNLCIKAWHLLKTDFPDLPPVYLHLHKHIPTGAGLGGGSADGAYTLRGLNELFKLGLSADQLIGYASQLGSDCPFFIMNEPCLGAGRGEILHPLSLSLKGYQLVLINPGIHISTREAFAGISPNDKNRPLAEIINQPIDTWQSELINDFESSIFPHHPEIERIKKQLLNAGAIYASMSGSGSTVYGIFKQTPDRIEFPSSYFIYQSALTTVEG